MTNSKEYGGLFVIRVQPNNLLSGKEDRLRVSSYTADVWKIQGGLADSFYE